jgi:hypothetical protein
VSEGLVVTLIGGPRSLSRVTFGGRYGYPVPKGVEVGPGFQVKIDRDGHDRLMRPVLYELIEREHPRHGRMARYVGLAP